ncbi:MAG TPA: YetF domain-containing protein [Vicinamibacterales bacterium]|nr:YetF domain-containing protein [Vicinamibacterales bacterium]
MIDAKTVHDMFWLGVPVLEKVLRPITIYLFLILGLRLAGKRELAQLNPFDLVVLLTISNTVQNAIIGEDNSVTGGLIGAATLLIVNHVVVRYLYGHARLERLVEGDEDVLIDNGEIQMDRLRKELITEGELLSAARKQGFARLDDVDRATIEPGGTVVFFGKKTATDTARHDELLSKLEELRAELSALRGQR